MSKIYEALLRAELDRVGIGLQDLPDQSDSLDDPSEQIDVLQSVAAPAGDHLVRASTLSIRQRPWSPVLGKLPGLQGRGHAAEQFRSLRSRLYEYRGFETLKTVLVSSGLPEEGKSFVAANLALSLARYKSSQVLLIDGDLRRSSLHHLFGCAHEPGLAEYLAGHAPVSEILQKAELKGEDQALREALLNLTFLPGGKGGDSVFDLSGNKRFETLLRQVEPHFDWIVIDSSPVNLVADAVNLAATCDGVLLVAKHGVTRYETLQQAQSEFKSAKVLGVVLNGAPEDDANQGYYGYGGDNGSQL